MLRGEPVPRVMTRVEAALTRATGPSGDGSDRVIFIDPDGHGELGTAHLRRPANIETDFHSGSARPVVGGAVRLTKRAVRRSLRWYVKPMMDQQSRFNHAILDIVEQLRMQDEKLLTGAILAPVVGGGPGQGRGADVAPDTLRGYVRHLQRCRRVVDLGCGRGGLLTLLRDAGVPAYGVDSDEGMVEGARAEGLQVVLGDAVSHLDGLDAGAVDGIFYRHVVERVGTPQLLALLGLCLRKLAPGGMIVVEMPDPETLSSSARFLSTDLTHVQPVHPDALRWAMEAVGFESVHIERAPLVEDAVRLGPVPERPVDEGGWAALAASTDRLNGLLLGPRSVAAVAVSPRRP